MKKRGVQVTVRIEAHSIAFKPERGGGAAGSPAGSADISSQVQMVVCSLGRGVGHSFAKL